MGQRDRHPADPDGPPAPDRRLHPRGPGAHPDPGALDPASGPAGPNYQRLADAYTQIESPVGPFGLATLTLSTRGIASGTATDDSTYTADEATIAALGAARDALGSAMIGLLEWAAFHGQHIHGGQARALIRSADQLIRRAESDASAG